MVRMYHNEEAVVFPCANMLSSLEKSNCDFSVRGATLDEFELIVVFDVAALEGWVPRSLDKEIMLCSSSEGGGEGIRIGLLCIL